MEGWVPCLLTVPHLQEFLVTLRLHRATLRHYITLSEQSWHAQVSKGGKAGQALRLEGGGAMGMGWAVLGGGLEEGRGHPIFTTSPTSVPKAVGVLRCAG